MKRPSFYRFAVVLSVFFTIVTFFVFVELMGKSTALSSQVLSIVGLIVLPFWFAALYAAHQKQCRTELRSIIHSFDKEDLISHLDSLVKQHKEKRKEKKSLTDLQDEGRELDQLKLQKLKWQLSSLRLSILRLRVLLRRKLKRGEKLPGDLGIYLE